MWFLGWLRPERRLFGIFLGVTVLPTAGLVWLGLQLVALDRSLADAQIEDRLKSAVAEMAGSIRREVETLDPSAIDPTSDAGAVVTAFRHDQLVRLKGAPLVFVPATQSAAEPAQSTWDLGERQEFEGDADAATAEYRRRAAWGDDQIRAGALARLARVLRAAGRAEDALTSYTDMAVLEHARVFGDPAPLVARLAKARTLDSLGRARERDDEARAIALDLAVGRWAIDRTTFEAAWRQVNGSASNAGAVAELAALAAGVEALWTDWRHSSRTAITWSGNRIASFGGHTVVMAWRAGATPDAATVVVASPRFFEPRWAPGWRSHNVHVALVDSAGAIAAGSTTLSPPVIERPLSDLGLPWTIRAASAEPEREFALQERRRWLVGTLIATSAFLVLAGAYFVARGAGRELAAARLQADFVAAVSHELRTPITSMSHLIEMLGDRQELDQETRQRYYGALAQEAGRLRRFVDRLLSLGRAESRHASPTPTALDPVDVVSDAVAAFREEPAASGRRISLNVGDVSAEIAGDREAIGLALHNLLENAAKYSPPGAPILVELAEGGSPHRIRVRVTDAGPGVAAGERDQIFEKFVRGRAAAQSGAPGTGIGLPLARQIARAHGGDITLDAETPTGATFTLTLPIGTATVKPGRAERAAEPTGQR